MMELCVYMIISNILFFILGKIILDRLNSITLKPRINSQNEQSDVSTRQNLKLNGKLWNNEAYFRYVILVQNPVKLQMPKNKFLPIVHYCQVRVPLAKVFARKFVDEHKKKPLCSFSQVFQERIQASEAWLLVMWTSLVR